MFDVGFSELIVIALVALIVIGPERLPRVARTVGALLGRAQRYVNDVKADIQREVELEELKNIRSTFEDAAKSVGDSINQVGGELNDAAKKFNESIAGAVEAKPGQTAEAPPAEASAAEASPSVPVEAQTDSTQLNLGLESKPAAEPAVAPKV